jgi:spermidine synthase
MRRDRPSTDARRVRSDSASAIAALCLTLSGAAGLIAEVCWIRRAALAFGSTVDAFLRYHRCSSSGWHWAGSLAGGATQQHRARALLEVALAALIIATLTLFDVAESLYGMLYRADPAAPALHAARAALMGSVILTPAFLMGGTLPLMCRQFVARAAGIGSGVAVLYAVNTLGAAAGALLCGFVLLPSLGMRLALLAAAGLDLLAGLLAAAVGWQQRVPIVGDAAAPSPQRPSSEAAPAAAVALLFFCAVSSHWKRSAVDALHGAAGAEHGAHHTITLAVVSSASSSGRWRSRPRGSGATRAPVRWFADRQRAPRARGLSFPVVAGANVVDAPCCCWRSPAPRFPGGAWCRDPRLAGVGVGRMAAANTLGGIAGALLIGFVTLPRLGLQTSLLVTTGVSVAAGCAAWWWLDRDAGTARRAIAVAVCVAAWLALPRLLATRIPQDLLAARHELIDYREGREANLAVISRQGTLQLEADRWWQGQDRKTHQVLAAHVPLLVHPAPRRVLIVGVGAGQTPASALTHPIERLDCVDIEPAVFDLVRARFEHAWMDDPRVHLIGEDGRSYVAHTAERYGVIALEVGQPSRPGVASFYTADFYALARARLAPGGLLSQFVPLPFLTADSFRSVVATFLSVFPHSIIWYNSAELLLLGVNADRAELAVDRLALLASQPALNADLRFAHWGGLAQSAGDLSRRVPRGRTSSRRWQPAADRARRSPAARLRGAARGARRSQARRSQIRPQIAPIASVLSDDARRSPPPRGARATSATSRRARICAEETRAEAATTRRRHRWPRRWRRIPTMSACTARSATSRRASNAPPTPRRATARRWRSIPTTPAPISGSPS